MLHNPFAMNLINVLNKEMLLKFASGFFPLVNSIVCILPIMCIGAVNSACAQTANTTPVFEAATIKSVIFDASRPVYPGPHVYSARVHYQQMTLKSLVRYAYDVQQFQVSGPASIDKDRYDIEARFPKGANEKDERKMLQALLKERFNLKFHVEKKDMGSYALVVGKHGAKLTPSVPEPKSHTDASLKRRESSHEKGNEREAIPIAKNKDGSMLFDAGPDRGTVTLKVDLESRTRHMERNKMNMEELAMQLGFCLGGTNGATVVNQTGLKGDFQIALDCPMTPPPSMAHTDPFDPIASDPQGGKSPYRSLDAIGLKLEKRKVPLDVYVIDHVEQPSDN